MFRPTAIPMVIRVGSALVIISSIGKAHSMAMIANAMYSGRRPNRSPSRPTTGTVRKPKSEPIRIASVPTDLLTASAVAR